MADTLCGTEAGGRAGLRTVEEMWGGIAQVSSAAEEGVGMSKEHDMDQSDLDGEGAEVGRNTGGGRDGGKEHDPQPVKIKNEAEKKEADADASSLDGEGHGVGRVDGGGKSGQ